MAGPLVGVLDAVDRVAHAAARVGGFLILLMMLSVAADAFLRSFANVALLGVAELNTFLLVALIYVGMAGTQASRANFRVSILADRLPPAVDAWIACLLLVLQIAAIGLLLWFSWNSLVFSIQRDEVSYGIITVPIWPSRLILWVGLALFLVQSVADLLRFLVLRIHPYKPPPLVEPGHEVL